MQTQLTRLLALVLAVASCAAAAQETDINWQHRATAVLELPDQIIVDHTQLRAFAPSAEPTATKLRGSMAVAIHAGAYPDATTGENRPASITVRYRNRLVAAATGYRLGSAITDNGIVIESWSGSDDCAFIRWRLEFAGERMVIANTERFRSPNCRNS